MNDPPGTISPIKYVLHRLKKDRWRLAAAIFWSILFVLIPMQIPLLTGILIDEISGGTQTTGIGRILVMFDIESILVMFGVASTGSEGIINFVVIALALVAVLYGVAAYFRTVSLAKVSRRFVAKLQKSLVQKAEILSLDIHSKYGSADLLNRAILDTQILRTFIENSIIKTVVKITQMAFPLVMLFIIDPFLAMLAASVLPILFIINKKLQKKLYKNSRKRNKIQAKLTSAVKEGFDAIESIQTAKAESYSMSKIFSLVENVEDNQIKIQKLSGIALGVVWGLTTIGLMLIWWQGGLKVLSGEMSIGNLVAFTGFALFVYQPSRNFTRYVNIYHKGIVAAERIQEILKKESSIQDSPTAVDADLKEAEIKFLNVHFTYPRRKATKHETLKGINLHIQPKSLTVIVGQSGSGKTTVLKLLTRLYDPVEGQIMINGRDIKEIRIESLRNQIAVVPQSPIIFSDTVFQNIALGAEDATKEAVREACRMSNAIEFIDRLKKRLNTKLGQRAATLSGGQVQRIAIARALIRKPKILLLDEPNSSLDAKSEAAIISSLENLKKHMTIIIVGHNMHAIGKIAERIIVIDHGKIVQEGTYAELAGDSGMYSTLYSGKSH